jgi:hypothetical protein
MIDATLDEASLSTSGEIDPTDLHSEEHLAERYMFLKDYDLLDIDHGHFWYKLSWHGVHVEFPSPQHHYEANPHERQIRDFFLSLPFELLEDAYNRLQDLPEYEFEHGDHRFRLVWDDEVQHHLHCYYQRSDAGRHKDRIAYQSRLKDHVTRYEHDRQFPSRRLQQKLAWLREERAKAQQMVDAWERLITQVEEQIAHDELLHTGRNGRDVSAS